MTPLPTPVYDDRLLVLPARIDLASAAEISRALLARVGADLTLDAGNVAHLGGLGVQVLLSAARHWRATGCVLRFCNRSECFDTALETFGISLSSIATGDIVCR